MNQVILTGTVAKVNGGTAKNGRSYAFLTVAVRGYKDNTDFIDTVAYNASADYITKYVNKGDLVEIAGRIAVSKQEKDGQTVYRQQVAVQQITKLRNGKVSAAAVQKNTTPVPEEDPVFGEDAEAVEPENAELPF